MHGHVINSDIPVYVELQILPAAHPLDEEAHGGGSQGRLCLLPLQVSGAWKERKIICTECTCLLAVQCKIVAILCCGV